MFCVVRTSFLLDIVRTVRRQCTGIAESLDTKQENRWESVMSDEYNGWTNRETWAFNLHWRNDQGFYNMVLDHARNYLSDTYGDEWAGMPADERKAAFWGVGESVVRMVQEDLPDLSPELWELMREDVGSWWRIDIAEVGEAIREDIAEESGE